ncbi:MAG: SAM-dependent methyltransferase, partial [Pseudomonadota bacterium]
MPLTLVSVPIGNPGDITLRALESLKEADLYIGEERKPLFRLIKELGLSTPQNYELLNEHTELKD